MHRLFLLTLFVLPLFALAQPNLKAAEKEFDSLLKTTTYGRNARAGKYYDIRGFKMYCEVYGSGQPLLLIHGNGGSINNFVKQIPYFSKKYKVIVADSRNQGKSADKGDSLSYEMMADDYAALLTQMGIDSAYVIGWSDGGINGLLLAMRHPEKVKKLVVTGANLRPDSTAIEGDVLTGVTRTYTMLREKENKSELDKKVYKLFKLLVEQPNIAPGDLHGIKAPTLVVGGDHDVIRPDHTLEIYQNIEQAYLWILPNSGHSTLVGYVDEFNKKADAFFKAPYRKIAARQRFF